MKKKRIPRAQMSTDRVYGRFFRISGAMYFWVPQIVLAVPDFTGLANPKSAILKILPRSVLFMRTF